MPNALMRAPGSETSPPRTRPLPLWLGPVALVVAMAVGFTIGLLLGHHDTLVSQHGGEFTAKVVAIKSDSICLAHGGQATCARPILGPASPKVGDSVRAVEVDLKQGDGTSTNAFYVLSVKRS